VSWRAASASPVSAPDELAEDGEPRTGLHRQCPPLRPHVTNLTANAQPFTVTDPIPANTEIVRRINYDPATNSVVWTGVVEPWGFRTAQVYVRVKSGTPGGR